mmetsp:Transcript_18217/g.25912  ORF Transcript_18217/g.25912 Transcript_18217/m.25912 type:complete len:107 (+) Transcript_18217:533-853(+)
MVSMSASSSVGLVKPGIRQNPKTGRSMREWIEGMLKKNHDDECNPDRTYQGDGEGCEDDAGVGLSEHTLTDGAAVTADELFKKNIHEINGLMELGLCTSVYLVKRG